MLSFSPPKKVNKHSGRTYGSLVGWGGGGGGCCCFLIYLWGGAMENITRPLLMVVTIKNFTTLTKL